MLAVLAGDRPIASMSTHLRSHGRTWPNLDDDEDEHEEPIQ
jgi:hypothetical protein